MPLSLIIKTLTCVSCEFDFKIVSIFFKYLKFRKWFKYGLKAQKLLAQGNALGIVAISNTPCFTLIEQALSVFFNVNYI